jgi:DNA-binding MarR family transcriptional regulator
MSVTEPGRSPGFLLWHATLRWQRSVAAALRPLGLTHVQFVLLASAWWLNEHGERPSQIMLAAHAGTDVKMTSQVIRSLEARGLVRREVDEADTRSRLVHVTRDGARLAPRAIAIVERVDEEFFATVPRRSALAVLAKLARRGEREG